MARSIYKDPSIIMKNEAVSLNHRRNIVRRAKRHSNKRDRQILKRDLAERIDFKLRFGFY